MRWPVMFQEWTRLTSLHWPYDPAVVQRMLPRGIEIDCFEGRAWVGLVLFLVERMPLPWISHSPQTNLRTYVKGPDGTLGVWFFSVDAASILSVAGGRMGYGLPCMWS